MLASALLVFCTALLPAGEETRTPTLEGIEVLLDAGEISRAEELANLLVDLERADPGVPPDAIADRLEQLGGLFYGTYDPEGMDAAGRFLQKALTIRERLADEDPGPLASLLHDLSGLAFNDGDYVAAEEAERRALAIRERIFPEGSPVAAQSRRDLALIFMAQGRLGEADALLPEAIDAIEASSPEDWSTVAIGRNYLAELYRLQGRYGDAAELLEELVRQAPGKLGTDSSQFHYILNGLAGIYRDQGRFDDAETLLRRSLALRKEAVPRDDWDVAIATLNLAELYRAQGNYDRAEALYREALDLARGSLGAGNPELFEFINQIAVLYRDQDRFGEAEPRFREALALAEQGFGPDHPRVAQSCLDLAELLRARGSCSDAEPFYERAIEIRETTLGPDHADVAEVLAAHARCLAPLPITRQEALAAVDRAVTILGRSEAHPAAAVDALALRADLIRETSPLKAREDLAEALRVVESIRPHRGGSESTRAEFFGQYAHLYERMVRWEVEDGHSDRALAIAERGRARALLDQLAAARLDEAGPDPVLARRQETVLARMAELRERLNFEQLRAEVPAPERHRRVEELERKLEKATREFRELYDEARNASTAWREASPGEPASAMEIQESVVPEDGLLLLYEIGTDESFIFLVPESPDKVEAIQLTIRQEDGDSLGLFPGPLTESALISILFGGPERESASDAHGLLARLASPGDSLSRGIGGLSPDREFPGDRLHALWNVLIPSGMRDRIAAARELVVIPDGPLFLLPFETLVLQPGPDPRTTLFWLDEGPPVRYAPSATFLQRLGHRSPSQVETGRPPTLLSVSDPAYGMPAESAGPPASGGLALRGSYLGAGGSLARLPGTADESRAIRAALGDLAEVVVLNGSSANETAVRREIPGKRYLHFATHGLVDDTGAGIFAALALTPSPGDEPAGEDDGFLQLFEIYNLTMDSELAVLSACSTNTGRVVAGEGIFALARGFLVGGARRVIASQWPVDDSSTAELMAELFRGIAAAEAEGKPLRTSAVLRDAKLSIRNGADWAHPFFWAPFVLTGVE